MSRPLQGSANHLVTPPRAPQTCYQCGAILSRPIPPQLVRCRTYRGAEEVSSMSAAAEQLRSADHSPDMPHRVHVHHPWWTGLRYGKQSTASRRGLSLVLPYAMGTISLWTPSTSLHFTVGYHIRTALHNTALICLNIILHCNVSCGIILPWSTVCDSLFFNVQLEKYFYLLCPLTSDLYINWSFRQWRWRPPYLLAIWSLSRDFATSIFPVLFLIYAPQPFFSSVTYYFIWIIITFISTFLNSSFLRQSLILFRFFIICHAVLIIMRNNFSKCFSRCGNFHAE